MTWIIPFTELKQDTRPKRGWKLYEGGILWIVVICLWVYANSRNIGILLRGHCAVTCRSSVMREYGVRSQRATLYGLCLRTPISRPSFCWRTGRRMASGIGHHRLTTTQYRGGQSGPIPHGFMHRCTTPETSPPPCRTALPPSADKHQTLSR